jgi:ABC-type glycerol-3-phosphate transport system permease component
MDRIQQLVKLVLAVLGMLDCQTAHADRAKQENRGLYNFSIKNGTFFNMLMAASALMTLPAIALFLGAQRYFIEGVALTGMKG